MTPDIGCPEQNGQMKQPRVELADGVVARYFPCSGGHSTGRPTIVLVHGLIVSSRYMMRLARSLSSDFDVYALDLPGFGHSSKPRAHLDTTQLGRTVVSSIASLGTGPALVVANSYGCAVATEAAKVDPSVMSGLVLIGPTVDESTTGLVEVALRFIRALPREPLWALGTTIIDALQCGPRRGLFTAHKMAQYRIGHHIGGVDLPVLLMRGEYDRVAPAEWLDRLALIARTRGTVTIPGAAHMANAGQPRRTAELIATWVSEELIPETPHG